MIFNNFDTH